MLSRSICDGTDAGRWYIHRMPQPIHDTGSKLVLSAGIIPTIVSSEYIHTNLMHDDLAYNSLVNKQKA
jgi:hypothetical protein